MNEGITLAQSDEINKYLGFRALFKNNATQVGLLPTFATRATIFESHLTDLEKAIISKNITSTGATIDKNLKKRAVAVYYEDKCQLTRNFAIDAGNNDLAKNINFTENSIFHLKDIEVYPQIVAINNTITPFLNDLVYKTYNITALTLSDGLALAADFRDYLHTNTNILHGKSVAGKSIDALLIPLRADNHSFNMQMTWHKKHANAFYLLYDEGNRINQTGNAITRLLGDVVEKGSGNLIPNAVITNNQLEKSVTADLSGHYSIEKFISGLYSYTITAPEFKPITVVLKSVSGESLTHNFELVAIYNKK